MLMLLQMLSSMTVGEVVTIALLAVILILLARKRRT